MSESSPDTLTLSRTVLRWLIRLNLLFGAFILAMFIANLVAHTQVMTAIGLPPGELPAKLFVGIRLVMVIGFSGVLVVHLVLARLLTIVETVSAGNPFVPANAARLRSIAWAVLVLELMHVAVVAIANSLSSEALPINVGGDLSLTPWLAVLLLFVLARVFEQGAHMREELEGTV